MADEWYYTMGGQQQGPSPLEHLKSWLANGQLQPTELVWREGMANWVPANTVPELQAAGAGAAAAGFAPAGGTFAPTVAYASPMYDGRAAAIKSQKSKAVTSLVLGIVGLVVCGVVLGIIAIVYANNAMREMKQNGSDEGKGMAIAGMILGIVDIALLVGVLSLRFAAR